MRSHDIRTRATAVILVMAMISSVVAMGVTVAGVGVAQTATSATIHDIDGHNASVYEISPEQNVEINYSIVAAANKSIRSAEVVFTEVTSGEQLARTVPAAKLTERKESIAGPSAEGFYEVELIVTDEEGTPASDGLTATNLDGFLVVDTNSDPEIEIDEPEQRMGGYPTIEGTASDAAGIDNVTLKIENESGNYWNFSSTSWQSDKYVHEVYNKSPNQTLGDATASWAYDIYPHRQKFDPGNYTITANGFDGDGNTIDNPEDSTDGDSPPEAPGGSDEETTGPSSIEYQLILEEPRITSVDVSPDTIEEGQDSSFKVNITVDPRGTSPESLGNASVDSAIQPESKEISPTVEGEGTVTYTKNIPIGDITAGAGTVEISVTIEEPMVQMVAMDPLEANTVVELHRMPADVSTLQVQRDFIGIIHDDADTIPVEIDGVKDATGNEVSTTGGNLTLSLDGNDIHDGFDTTRGAVTADIAIDPSNDLGHTDKAGSKSLILKYDGNKIGKTNVTLVHEAYDLEPDTFQPVGTPMPATDVRIESTDDPTIYQWNPDEEWEDASVENLKPAGSAALIDPGESETARIGYTFDTSTSDTIQTETLASGENESGYHFIGATPNLNTQQMIDTQAEWEDDLIHPEYSEITQSFTDTEIMVYPPQGGTSITDNSVTFDWDNYYADELNNADVSAYGAYWIQLDSTEGIEDLTRAFNTTGYNKEERSNNLNT